MSLPFLFKFNGETEESDFQNRTIIEKIGFNATATKVLLIARDLSVYVSLVGVTNQLRIFEDYNNSICLMNCPRNGFLH